MSLFAVVCFEEAQKTPSKLSSKMYSLNLKKQNIQEEVAVQKNKQIIKYELQKIQEVKLDETCSGAQTNCVVKHTMPSLFIHKEHTSSRIAAYRQR